MAETAHAGPGSGPTRPGATGGSQGGGGAQEKAQQVAGDAKEQAKEQAQQVKEQAEQQAQQVKEQAGGRLKGEVDRRSTQAGERVKSQASDLRSVGEQLREQGKEAPAKVADRVAERAERVGGYLEESDGERILNDLEDIARRNPWAVVAGGLVLGIAASRFIKASSIERSQRRGATGPDYGRPAIPASTTGRYGGPGAGGGLGPGAGLGTGTGGLGAPTPPSTGVGDAFGAPAGTTPGTAAGTSGTSGPDAPRFDREDDPMRRGGGL
jgi:hypothetical protein